MAKSKIEVSFNLGTLVNSIRNRSIKKHSNTKNRSNSRYKDMKGIIKKSLSRNKIKKRFEV